MGSVRRPAEGSRPWRRCSGQRAGWVQILVLPLKSGARLLREWHGRTHTVTVTDDAFDYAGTSHSVHHENRKEDNGSPLVGSPLLRSRASRYKL